MQNPEQKPDAPLPEPANLVFLRRLVTGLTVVMIAGVVTITALIVMRFRSVPPPLPNEIELPGDAAAMSFTQGDDWFAVVTTDRRILIFDRITGALRQTVEIAAP